MHIPGRDRWRLRSSLKGSVLLEGQGVDPARDPDLLASCLGCPGSRQSSTGIRSEKAKMFPSRDLPVCPFCPACPARLLEMGMRGMSPCVPIALSRLPTPSPAFASSFLIPSSWTACTQSLSHRRKFITVDRPAWGTAGDMEGNPVPGRGTVQRTPGREGRGVSGGQVGPGRMVEPLAASPVVSWGEACTYWPFIFLSVLSGRVGVLESQDPCCS